MKYKTRLYYVLFFMTASTLSKSQNFDLQGHRGARGLLPENTIPALIKALDLGVTTLEMDAVITGDNQVILSHEPYFSSAICLNRNGDPITKSEEQDLNIFEMTYNEVKEFDCGSIGNARFPDQRAQTAHKPLLADVIREVETHIKGKTRYLADYNIEIKSSPSGDGIYHPEPSIFSELLFEVIDKYLPWDRVIIQSFDLRVLQYFNDSYPDVRIAFLVENTKSISKNLDELGFIPEIYSPYYALLSKQSIDDLHTRGIRVIPWTINKADDMSRMAEMGVDGLITDYPNIAADLGLGVKIPYGEDNRQP